MIRKNRCGALAFALIAVSALGCGRAALAADNSSSQPAPDKFELRAVAGGLIGWEAVRFNRRTGAAWTIDLDPKAAPAVWKFKLTKIADEKVLPLGDYDVQIIASPNGRPAGILRIERSSGKCWVADKHKWQAVEGATK